MRLPFRPDMVPPAVYACTSRAYDGVCDVSLRDAAVTRGVYSLVPFVMHPTAGLRLRAPTLSRYDAIEGPDTPLVHARREHTERTHPAALRPRGTVAALA
ncbi:hypothetical protein GCM10027590_57350 [Nocardiopsis nanhaiensis]